MPTLAVLIALCEKISLLAAAALVAVLFPPLRKRLVGSGRRRDKLVALAFGLAMAAWGTLMGFEVLGEYINVRSVGILVTGILGGLKAGTLVGLLSGYLHAGLVGGEAGTLGLFASLLDGVIAGYIGSRRPHLFVGWRLPFTAMAAQFCEMALLGLYLSAKGTFWDHFHAWPAQVTKVLVSAVGASLVITMARIVVAREATALALLRAEAAADAAALDALRRRLEPHFLFNALNVLRATIRVNPPRARELVSDLADLYRYLLQHPEEAPLREEVDHALAYLEIERARLGDDRMVVDCEVDREAALLRVPALLLQPLVENAVKHGVSCGTGVGRIVLRASVDDDALRLVIMNENDGPLLYPSPSGHGIAIKTLRQRIEKRYGQGASITLDRNPRGAQVQVTLPFAVTSQARAA